MGNGWCEVTGWNLLPDPVLLSIFMYLDSKELVTVSEVCWHWSRVSKDNSLWRRRMALDFKLNPRTPLAWSNTDGSWLSEYRRLMDDYPSVESETLTHHGDEVLHVSFSNDGALFATCSKDCSLKIWRVSYPCLIIHDKDLSEMFHWKYTQFSQFNSEDNLILVSGVHVGSNSTSGEIAVFELKGDELEFRSRVLNKPYDVFGCWYDEGHLVSGDLHWISQMSSTSDIYLSAASQEIESEQKSVMARLFRFFNRNASTLHMTLVSHHVSPWLRYAVDMTEKYLEAEKAGVEFDIDLPSVGIQGANRNELPDLGACASVYPSRCSDKLLIFCTGQLTYTPHQVGFKLLRSKTVGDLLDAEVMPPERVKEVMERIRLYRESIQNQPEPADDSSSSDDEPMDADVDGMDEQNAPDQAPVQNPDDNLNWQEILEKFDFADHVVEMNGHVIGMALSNDQRYLFVNVRPWPDGCLVSNPWEPPPIAQQIEIRVIDLETLALLDVRYTAHKGFTPSDECFFIFLDACDQYVSSGSEDSFAYIWDRDYGCLVGKLAHSGVVNSVAFHPKNSSVMISASDDHTVKVWRSKANMRAKTASN